MSTFVKATVSADSGLHTILREIKSDIENNPQGGHWVQRDSRAGPTIEFNGVAVIENLETQNYVSQCPVRKANPFFHLAEAMWMLAGREDLDFLLTFNKSFGQYSDDGVKIRGSAYGIRWRSWFGVDQIDKLVAELTNNESRRAVLTQWDPADLNLNSKDVPCNLQTLFIVRNGYLDMTVTNRSNDLVYGMYGSNIVHFTILHQYVAAKLNLPVGVYRQVSNCLHIYTENEVVQRLMASTNELPRCVEEVLVADSSEDAVKLDIYLTTFFAKFDESRAKFNENGEQRYRLLCLDDALTHAWDTVEFEGLNTPFIFMFHNMMKVYFKWKHFGIYEGELTGIIGGFSSAAQAMLSRSGVL